jgi:hypothetical protein
MLRTLGAVSCAGLLFGSLAIGCDVGSLPDPGDDNGATPDSRPPPGSPDASTIPTAVCKNTVVGVGNGNHNPGLACLQAGCHAAGGEGPTFTLAGTAYTDALGTAPQVGATITVRDAVGLTVDLPTQQNGNFYSAAVLQMPVSVYASECPGIMQMTATAAGDCNTGGCHDGVAATGRVYLP